MARKTNSSLAKLIAAALIGAVAFVVMKFEFPIMPGVGFLKFDFSDVIITVGTFSFGVGAGVLIALIRGLISLIFSGFALPTIVGQIAAFLASLSFALPFYYLSHQIRVDDFHHWRARIRPAIGLIIGILVMTILLALANAFILTPIYAVTSMAHLPHLTNYASLLNFTVKVYLGQLLHLPSMQAYILGIIVPFNLLKGLINAIVVYLLLPAMVKNIRPFVRQRF